MKYLLILLTIITTHSAISQIYGDIALDKRAIVNKIEYVRFASKYTTFLSHY